MICYLFILIFVSEFWQKLSSQFCNRKNIKEADSLLLNVKTKINKRKYKLYRSSNKFSTSEIENIFSKLKNINVLSKIKRTGFTLLKKVGFHIKDTSSLGRSCCFNYYLCNYIKRKCPSVCTTYINGNDVNDNNNDNDEYSDSNNNALLDNYAKKLIITNNKEKSGSLNSLKNVNSVYEGDTFFIANKNYFKNVKHVTYRGKTTTQAFISSTNNIKIKRNRFKLFRTFTYWGRENFFCTEQSSMHKLTKSNDVFSLKNKNISCSSCNMLDCGNSCVKGYNVVYVKSFINNILKSSFIYNYVADKDMKRLLQEIYFLFYKLQIHSYEEGNLSKGEGVITNVLRERYIEKNKKKDDQIYMQHLHSTIHDEINKADVSFRNSCINCSEKDCNCSFSHKSTEVILKIWLIPLHLMFINKWMDTLLVNYLHENNCTKEYFIKNNILIKCENDLEKRLFFHLQCFYYLFFEVGRGGGNITYDNNDQINDTCNSSTSHREVGNGSLHNDTSYGCTTHNSSSRDNSTNKDSLNQGDVKLLLHNVQCEEKRTEQNETIFLNQKNNTIDVAKKKIIIYLYRDNDENMENFYSYLKRIYKNECISFFNYERYVHHDNSSFIILLSYEEFLNLSFHWNNNSLNIFEQYVNNKVSSATECSNLFKLFTKLLTNPTRNSNNIAMEIKGNCYDYTFKIFLDDFNLKYNYETGVIEKNLYENLFSIINWNEKRAVTLYFLSSKHFNLQLFKIWVENIHKNCTFLNLTKNKHFFVLHKKFILKLDEICDAYDDGSNKQSAEEKEKRPIGSSVEIPTVENKILGLVQNKKKNISNERAAKSLLLFKNCRKDIIINYLKEHNLYNLNKLKKKDKKIKRKLNIARRFFKKKKIYNMNNLEISHYIDFIVNKKKKGSIFFKKKIIDLEYITKEENLQLQDKINILTKNVHIAYQADSINEQEGYERKDIFSDRTILSNCHRKNSNFSFLKNQQRNNLQTGEIPNDTEGKHGSNNYLVNGDQHIFNQTYVRRKTQHGVILPQQSKFCENKLKFFYLKKDDIIKQNDNSSINETEVVEIYPCIYYIFNMETFLNFSTELYERMDVLDELFMQKCRYLLKKYEHVIHKNLNFKKYLAKGLFLINQKLNKYEIKFVKELLKNNILKVILSCVDISSEGIEVNSVFIEDVQVHMTKKRIQYNRLIDMINHFHSHVFYNVEYNEKNTFRDTNYERGGMSHIHRDRNDIKDTHDGFKNGESASDDMHRLHFIKYFIFLNFRNIFRKYTLSNNDLLNLSKNSRNYFLILKRYEDAPVLLNIQNHNYLNLSNMHKPLIIDFYFNLYYFSIIRGISLRTSVFDNMKKDREEHIKDSFIMDKFYSSYCKSMEGDKEGKLSYYINDNINSCAKEESQFIVYKFFSSKYSRSVPSGGRELFYIISNIVDTSFNIHKIYKYRQLNESILINNYIHISNNITYAINYFEFLYFYFMNNKNLEHVFEQTRYSFFNFLLMERVKYEKEYIKYNKEYKIAIYKNKVEKIKKYFDVDYAYMYYNTYINYNKLKKRITCMVKKLYKEKYDLLLMNLKSNYKNKVVLTVYKSPCIVLDIYKAKKEKTEKTEKMQNNLYICVNDMNELFICNIYFFYSVVKNEKLYNYIKEKNKHINYFDHLFLKREIQRCTVFSKELNFPFDIHKKGGSKWRELKTEEAQNGVSQVGEPEKECNRYAISTSEKYIFEFFVNKIKLNNPQNYTERKNYDKKEENFQQYGTEKLINIDDILFNSYNESLYYIKNYAVLYLKKLKKMKKVLYSQYIRRKKDIRQQKNKKEKIILNNLRAFQLSEHNNMENHEKKLSKYYREIRDLNEVKKNYIFPYSNSGDLNKSLLNISPLNHEECKERNKDKSKKILSIKIMRALSMYKKKKNIGNRNSYLNELNKINRIFGNKENTSISEFYNILSLLKNFNLIDNLKSYINPYIKNTLWLYITTLYVNHKYSLCENEFNVHPELLIIIFYICFSKNKPDYVCNYLSSFQISNGFLREVVTDIFAYKELLSFVQRRFKINIDIMFNLCELDDVLEGLVHLKNGSFGNISENVVAKLTQLTLVLHNGLLRNFNKNINKIILNFIKYIRELKKYKEGT
ncbi:conserved Plasmodium protein, unknown function [Plasmodium malariae]|uniref:Uncharacterized protein n=1 Tax=Plasmodium malariae TaxID=5858 RepID=A0A1C3KES1_PLAMA|nr:conserved Plasmodium protein, unknown function [Plasmodium malariae]